MVIDFIKSLFLPTKMVRYRYMSVLFSIAIFVISSYILMVPAKVLAEDTFTETVYEENNYYLQSVTNITAATPNANEVFEEIKNKGLTIDKETSFLIGTNMGCSSVQKDDSILGILELNADNLWKYNGVDTTLQNNAAANNKPIITINDQNKLVINEADSGVVVEGVAGEVEVIELTVSNTGYILVNGNSTIISTKEVVKVSKDAEGFICVNGVKTSVKSEKANSVVYFTPNKNVTYYENSIKYTNDKGINVNLKIIIDLAETPLFDPNKDFKYSETDTTFNERYPDINTNDYYVIVFRRDCVYYQAHPFDIQKLGIERDGNPLSYAALYCYYSSVDVDSEMFNGVENSVNTLFSILRIGYLGAYNSLYNLSTLIYCVGFTALFAGIFWLFFRKNGRLTKLKEYYNIGAICAIPVTLVCFVILWLFPDIFMTVYPLLYIMYYLFILYKINSLPEIV